ncbi:MAG: polyprenyl synthetase family protein [Planctomycetota bacterium]
MPTPDPQFQQVADAVDAYMRAYVRDVPLPVRLREAIEYALLGGGKRLRPTLAWACCEAAGAAGEASLPGGAAVELVHAFSLVHDDLPAMDDDDLRRGRPTLHKHADEATAILAGDAMLALAFGVIAWPGPGGDARPAEVTSALCAEIVRGTTGMIAGQVYDTLGGFSEDLGTPAQLELIHRNKTGALLVGAGRCGALLGGAGGERLETLTRVCADLGLQFQIVDDLLDATADAAEIGKATGKDADAGKLTFPVVHGIEASRGFVAELGTRVGDTLAGFGPEADRLRALTAWLSERTR